MSDRERLVRRATPAALLVMLLAILALPFLARSRRRNPGSAALPASETLVVLTPHNEAVRHEFGRGFAAYMAARGRHVQIDWRAPGGAGEIARYLNTAYTASFERHWTQRRGRPWSARVAAGFMSPGIGHDGEGEAVLLARQEFLTSSVGCGIDVLFGGGSSEHVKHAAAGRLVDAGLVRGHPEIFGPTAIPQQAAGQPYWDVEGRWMGTCLTSFGICFNGDLLRRLGVAPPASWAALADERLHGQVALADPTKSGSIAKGFETMVQAQMQSAGVEEGWAQSMRLIRRIAGNARYFTDAASKIPLDVANGDAAAGMCIDYYGRFQSEITAALGHPERVGFIAPRGATGTDTDPIGLLRGAPHRALAVSFIEFVLSEAGQKLWAFRRGAPGGPQRYTLRRLAILPRIYEQDYDRYRSDPEQNPYREPAGADYRQPWTGPFVGAMAFVIRAMCVDVESELQEAYGALARAGFPPRATATFDDVTLVDYGTVTGPIHAALKAPDPLEEAAWRRRLGGHFRQLYRRVQALAREGQ